MNTINNNLEFTLAWQARSSFMQAKLLTDMIHQFNLGEDDPRTATIFGAISGHYMAPFMRTNNLGCLKADDIPPEHTSTHDNLRTLRNQVFMHLDKGVNFDGRTDVTNLRVKIHSDRDTVEIESKSWTPKPHTLEQIISLLEWWITSLSEPISKYMQSCASQLVMVPGNYILKTEGTAFELEQEQ